MPYKITSTRFLVQCLKQGLVITTFNVEDITANMTYTDNLLERCDILCLQEHWLHTYEGEKELNNRFPNHNHIIKCFDDNIPVLPQMRTTGHSGTAILWKKDLDRIIEPLSDGSDRLTTVKVHSENNVIVLINTYMPTQGCKETL